MSVKVILRQDLNGVGKRGDIVDVSDGHARNYLLPKGLAFVATPGAVEQANAMRRSRDLRDASDREAAQTVATSLVAKVITIAAKAGAEGRLYGSVGPAEVAEAIEKQTSIVIDKKNLHMEPAKVLGEHTATARLHSDVTFPITIEIVAR